MFIKRKRKNTIPLLAMLVTAILFACCTSDKQAITDVSNIRYLDLPQSGEDTLKASYFADTVIYIPLETKRGSFIDDIMQLWTDDSLIIVYSERSGLLMFQQDGRFVRKIGQKGKGPGEYLIIHHFDVIHDTIYISSTGRRSFLRHTIDGNFCDEIELNYEPVFFSTTVDQKLACYVRQEGKVYVYDKGFFAPSIIRVEYAVTKGRYYYSYYDPFATYFQKTNSGLLFNNYLNDTIWSITSNNKEPAYILDLKESLLPYDKQIEFCNGDFQRWGAMMKSYCFVHLIPFPSWMIIFKLPWFTAKYDAIYLNNIKSGEIRKFNTSYIYDDIVGKQRLSYFHFIYSKDYLVSSVNSYNVIDYLHKYNNIKGSPSLLWLNQMKTIKEDDNPILVLIKIKRNI